MFQRDELDGDLGKPRGHQSARGFPNEEARRDMVVSALSEKRRTRRPLTPFRNECVSDSLLQRVGGNDASAVSEVLSRYGSLVWAIVRRQFTDSAEAEDLVQEIFLDVWRSAHRFDPSVASEATFITMIARRRLIDRRRKRERRPEAVPLPEQLPSPTSNRPDPAELQEDVAQAKEAMAQLRPEQRKVLELSIYNGLTHERISETTGMPLGTVKTHARRGLLRVRELLGGTKKPKGVSP